MRSRLNNLSFFFFKQISREGRIYCRQPRIIINATLFFFMIIVFFPLTMPAKPSVLSHIAPGIIWMALLLSTLLASEQIFQQDFDAGVLEQYLISAPSLTLFIAAKIFVHWCLVITPILLLCPLLALLFNFSMKSLIILMSTLITGSPGLVCLAALATAFGLSMEQKGTFMGLILFILALPVMIFGSSAFEATEQGLPIMAYLAILTAVSLVAVAFLPFAISAVIRIKLAD